MKEFVVRYYDNGATEIICLTDGARRVVYNTGDIVHFYGDKVICIRVPNNNKSALDYTSPKWIYAWEADNVDELISSLHHFTVHNGRPCK